MQPNETSRDTDRIEAAPSGGATADVVSSILLGLTPGISTPTAFPRIVDRVHRHLLSQGVSDSQARDVNRGVLELLMPPLPRISTFELFLTRWCNLDCSYCFVHNKRGAVMAGDVLGRSLAFIQSQLGSAKGRIVFMGGEPTSQFRAIRRVVEAMAQHSVSAGGSVSYDITSNGTLIDENMMRFFAANKVRVLLSIDGARKAHDRHRRTLDGGGSYELVMARLPTIRRYQPFLGSKMTITPESVFDLLEDVKLLASLGVRKFILGHATGVDWSASQQSELARQLAAVHAWSQSADIAGLDIGIEDAIKSTASCSSDNLWGCRAGVTGVAIDVDGVIYPCSKTIGTAHRQMVLGHVDQGITNEALRLQLCGYTPSTRAGCGSCAMSTVCKGGCYAVNAESTGDPFRPAPTECSITSEINRAYNAIDGGRRPTDNFYSSSRKE